MGTKRCEGGHFFDTDKHSSCPFCGVDEFGSKETKPLEKDPDMPGIHGSGIPTNPKKDRPTQPGGQDKKTIGIYQRKLGMDPVVGWLVIIEGPDRGRDFMIHSENNYIGRNEKRDIALMNDDTISRDKPANVSYDPEENEFVCVPGDGRSGVRVNGKKIHGPTPLNRHDIIKLGETKLMFVPLCGEDFKW